VLLNANSGEILAIASHPSFNPNNLEQNWSTWINDRNSPFLDRATQGLYPIGTALGPFLLARVSEKGPLPGLPQKLTYTSNGTLLNCAIQPQAPQSWSQVISNGCPAALVTLGNQLSAGELKSLYKNLALDQTPDLPIPVARVNTIPAIHQKDQASLGQLPISVSPMQMALTAAALSSGGNRPFPKLAISVHTTTQGWVIFSSGSPVTEFPADDANDAAQKLASNVYPIWQTVATAQTQKNVITWYLGGTDQDWKGSPLALALVLEQDNPALAEKIGSSLLSSTVQP